MKRFQLLLVAGAILVLAGAYGSAALSSLTIDRTATATVDTDTNAFIKIECINNTAGGGPDFTTVCQGTGGVVALQLDKAVGASAAFNRSGSFTIGSSTANNRVMKVTNNGTDQIKAYMTGTDISMLDTAGAAVTSGVPKLINAGASAEFYFTLTSPASGSVGTNTLAIRLGP